MLTIWRQSVLVKCGHPGNNCPQLSKFFLFMTKKLTSLHQGSGLKWSGWTSPLKPSSKTADKIPSARSVPWMRNPQSDDGRNLYISDKRNNVKTSTSHDTRTQCNEHAPTHQAQRVSNGIHFCQPALLSKSLGIFPYLACSLMWGFFFFVWKGQTSSLPAWLTA